MNFLHCGNKRTVLIGLFAAILILSVECSKSEKTIKEQTLMGLSYSLLPIGDIQPEGWVLNTLEAMRDGMTGHLDELWEDVGPDCGWIGGSGPAWERPVYWLDGLVPLAYILNDQKLIDKGQ